MSWTTIDQALCDGCGFCMVRCPRNYSKENGEIIANSGMDTCNLCGHCVSLCEPGAITHNKMDMNNFYDMDTDANFDTEKFVAFIRNRRSHRLFKKNPIAQKDLEYLVDSCRYAPTGSNVQTVEIVVIQNQDKMKILSDHTVDVFERMGQAAIAEAEQFKNEGKPVPEAIAKSVNYMSRLTQARSMDMDPIFHRAPAMIIFHSPIDTSAPEDNCLIASTTMSLIARTMGIESTYIGLFKGAARNHEKIHAELNLPLGNRIYSVLIMGYPRLKFHRTVDRKPIQARWE